MKAAILAITIRTVATNAYSDPIAVFLIAALFFIILLYFFGRAQAWVCIFGGVIVVAYFIGKVMLRSVLYGF